MTAAQSTHHVLMIRPASFASNTQTAASNSFQRLTTETVEQAQAQALMEFDAAVVALRAAGVRVQVMADTPQPSKPDAIFPNNWVSFHADGTVVLYPMMAENRRLERRLDVLQTLSQQGFRIQQTIDLCAHEASQQFLEGTGSLVLDRVNRLAYACLSPRTDMNVLGDFAQRLDYELVVFEACDAQGAAIYHTNVLLCVGTHFAVLCTAAIAAHERGGVLQALRSTGHTVIEIAMEQMQQFAGNMLELRDARDQPCVAMSQSAFTALTLEQRQQLTQLAGPLIAIPIPTIERLGGGSVRCMLAEVFLPPK